MPLITPTMSLKLSNISLKSLLAPGSVLLASYVLVHLARILRRRRRTTRLLGPPSKSFLFGHSRQLATEVNPADLTDKWFAAYGPALELATPLGGTRIMLADPKAMRRCMPRTRMRGRSRRWRRE